MMNHRKSAMGRSRDFGTGAGKGDASRIDDQQTFSENLGEVKFDGVSGMRKVGAAKFVKTYGASKQRPPDVYVENESEWQPLGSIHKTTSPTNDLCRE